MLWLPREKAIPEQNILDVEVLHKIEVSQFAIDKSYETVMNTCMEFACMGTTYAFSHR